MIYPMFAEMNRVAAKDKNGLAGFYELRKEANGLLEAQKGEKAYSAIKKPSYRGLCFIRKLERKRVEILGSSRRVLQKVMAIGGSGPRFPVPHKELSLDIKGNKTDIVICSYEDHFLVIGTQIGTMGTLLHARKEEGMSILPTFNISVIFGKRDEPMLLACARQLIEHISTSGSSKSLVLSLGLRDHSAETLKGFVSAVIENRSW